MTAYIPGSLFFFHKAALKPLAYCLQNSLWWGRQIILQAEEGPDISSWPVLVVQQLPVPASQAGTESTRCSTMKVRWHSPPQSTWSLLVLLIWTCIYPRLCGRAMHASKVLQVRISTRRLSSHAIYAEKFSVQIRLAGLGLEDERTRCIFA